MAKEIYETPLEALEATNGFYKDLEGFQYSEDQVTKWLDKHIKLPRVGNVLDLCCGDGIWSKGMKILNPNLEYFGIDISSGAIEKARILMESDSQHFVIGDAEGKLPFEDSFFDVIFARGPGLYNQHSMDRLATIKIIEDWHNKLSDRGLFYSIFASTPEKMGTYTPMNQVKLPYNRSPRKTEAVDFLGGKYHHNIESFLTPFWKAENVKLVSYSFVNNMHVLVTKKDNK
ncbi:class I SAM-dependent methyltransferase [Desulfuribacillus alkaliarsenatis]|uniref:Methyltransferase domain-containing protein n=1 Tax=Desulfuribacillus alkaliarsenatis TaxID=766136 RepID=A0A1E5G1X1_9FIRM|nr:class I SAM-dependent methyltransferase [Desulfuribacillus alkaliarsenatis]OEF96826.1 hypothetical protein BHF68_07135 [Desulfuribacillus alkaliarsenatis]